MSIQKIEEDYFGGLQKAKKANEEKTPKYISPKEATKNKEKNPIVDPLTKESTKTVSEAIKIDEDDIISNISDIMTDISSGAPSGTDINKYVEALIAKAIEYNMDRIETMKDDFEEDEYEEFENSYNNMLRSLKVNIKIKA